MADLLVRDLDPSTKTLLAERAERSGRSQQAEAKAILEAALRGDTRGWPARLRQAAQATGGIELELPERHAPRAVDAEGWL